MLAQGLMVAPQTIEVDLTDGACNQACGHCCFDSGNAKEMVSINPVILNRGLTQAYKLGTRAVEFVGGAEPTAHPGVASILGDTLEIGNGDMEAGIITNGVLAERILPVAPRMRYVRVSLDSADETTYNLLHKAPQHHFRKVLKNLARLRSAIPIVPRARQLGIGYLVVPPLNHHAEQIVAAAELAHKLNVDYIVYRPVEVATEVPQEFWEQAQQGIVRAKQYLRQVGSHTVAFGGTGTRWDTLRPGGHPTGICDAKPLVAVIQANGDVAFCILNRNRRDLTVGNIADTSFEELWFSETHREAWQSFPVDGCPNPCKFYHYNRIVRDARSTGVVDTPPSNDEVAHHLFV